MGLEERASRTAAVAHCQGAGDALLLRRGFWHRGWSKRFEAHLLEDLLEQHGLQARVQLLPYAWARV